MSPNSTQLSAMTSLFSASVFHEMAKRGQSPRFRHLIEVADIDYECSYNNTIGSVFDFVFSILKETGFRDEYMYRSALTQHILTEGILTGPPCILSEFRAGICRVDLVILKDTTIAYEIKSDRDSLVRLANQINNYRKVFASVFVIASKKYIGKVLDIVPEDVGVMELLPDCQILTIRDADDRPDRICQMTVFDSLRTIEAESILRYLNIPTPNVPNTIRRAAILDRFKGIDSTMLHMAMVETLKRTRDLGQLWHLVNRMPKSLQAASLSIPIKRADHNRLVSAISTPFATAMTWN